MLGQNQAREIQKNSPDKMNSRSLGIDRSWASKGSRLVLWVTAAFTATTAESRALSSIRAAGLIQDRSRTSLGFIGVIQGGKIVQKVGQIVNFVGLYILTCYTSRQPE